MSSADRCRVVLLSRISRILRRGSVTFRPALRRSLPSTAALLRSRYDSTHIIAHRTPVRLPLIRLPYFAARSALLLLLLAGSSGCVYRMNIQQGNFLEAR